jgi:hypothetical protein
MKIFQFLTVKSGSGLARFEVGHYWGFYGCFGRHDWEDFQDGNKPLGFIFQAVPVAPAVSSFGLWVSRQSEHFDFTLPNGLAAKHFMHWHCFEPLRSAVVQVLNCGLDLRYVILPALHIVQSILQPSIRDSQRQPKQRGRFNRNVPFAELRVIEVQRHRSQKVVHPSAKRIGQEGAEARGMPKLNTRPWFLVVTMGLFWRVLSRVAFPTTAG